MLLLAATIPSSPGGPPLDATTAEAAEYIAGLDESWEPAVAVVADVAMTILLWFMVGLGLLLRRVEGEVSIRSTVAMLSGVLVAAHVALDPTERADTHRVVSRRAQLAFALDVTASAVSKVGLPMRSGSRWAPSPSPAAG